MIKKIKEKITLKHLKSYYIETLGFDPYKDSIWHEFYVLFNNGKYEHVYDKYDLINMIGQKHNEIRCIFDQTDKIILDKDIDVTIAEKEK